MAASPGVVPASGGAPARPRARHAPIAAVPRAIGAARHRLKTLARDGVGPVVAALRPTRNDLPWSRWGLSVGPNGRLWSAGVDLEELARTQGTPLHLVRADALDRNAHAALAPLEGSTDAGADIFYSYKTNPVPAVLARLHRSRIGAEVISPFELWLALRLGVPPERIIYNGPAKSPESLRSAIRHGILAINANSRGEAAALAGIAASEQSVANLGIRVALPGMWGGQFGIAADSAQLVEMVRWALTDPHVDLRGLHFHRGSSIRHRDEMAAHVEQVLGFCDELRRQTGWHPRLLDLGGSLSCPSVQPIPARELRLNRAVGCDLLPPDPFDCLSIGDASALAARLIADHFASVGLARPRVVLEPGRALTGDTQLLLATVLDVKYDGRLPHAILDAGIGIAEPVVGEYHQLFSVSSPLSAHETSYRLAGPICTPADVLYNNWRLPELEPGHVLAIMDTGAYFVPFSTSFSFPRASVLLQEDDRLVLGRRRETFDDMVACDAEHRFDEQ